MNTLLEAALHYAELGYRVFPCAPGQKTPLTARGFHDATTDSATIEAWWRRHPSANVAIATEGLLVVDVDGADNRWLQGQPERLNELATGAVSITPRGGRHFIFRQPTGASLRCQASRLAPHVDVRADGGYILAPPSTVDDKAYAFVPGLELDTPRDQLTEPPAWLLVLMCEQPAKPAVVVATDGNQIPEGQRNATLARLGGGMRRMGMSADEIAAALCKVNSQRCIPAMPIDEVQQIAESVARYEPDQISVALVEDHWSQIAVRSEEDSDERTVRQMVAECPTLREPIIHGLLREGETMNVIASPKVGKSWLVTDLALAVATGKKWLNLFDTEQGNVLIIDNELHRETSAHRIPKVMEARGISMDEAGDNIVGKNVRGRLKDLNKLATYFEKLRPGRFKVIILDAFYRFMPKDTDENDNGTIGHLYNILDIHSLRLNCAFVLVHHSTKGNQAGKLVTDVGAGAGSQSRAADTHLILRSHEERDVVVLDAAVRSFPPIEAQCVRWTFPVWQPAPDLDPEDLKSDRPRRKPRVEVVNETPSQPLWTVESFVQSFVTDAPQSSISLIDQAVDEGLKKSKAEALLCRAEEAGLIHRWRTHDKRGACYANRPAPVLQKPIVDAFSGKRQAVLALFASEPELSNREIADRCGVSHTFVRKLRSGPTE